MSTNYYEGTAACYYCGRSIEWERGRFLGKNVWGKFMFRITLEEIKQIPDTTPIFDEYGKTCAKEEFVAFVESCTPDMSLCGQGNWD